MLDALEPLLSAHWTEVRIYAEGEALKMAETLVTVASLRQNNLINDDRAIALIDMQRHSAQAVLLTVEGIGLVTAQHAVNALLGAVKDRFNGDLPLPLL
jgi:hypothetical protein